ncbi:MAG: hypothetical protein ACSLFN_11680 [Candidatus Limnocylindrales bacterium]
MIRGRAPHAVLLVGAEGVGKTTLALDLAAGLLCTADDPAARPCGTCRACRMVAAGGHPDVHRLAPEGPGRQVGIGGPGAHAPGIRDLISALSLLPVEGGARIAIVESAQRMNEDAQAALLKTLEEPPGGVTLILCADAEEPLLPTIRSRCARLRLGPVGARDIESILAAHGVADPPLAARLARASAGRPGLALAWAADPEVMRTRGELARSLLDLVDLRPADRLAGVRTAAGRAARLSAKVDPVAMAAPPAGGRRAARSQARGPAASRSAAPPEPSAETDAPPGSDPSTADGGTASVDDALAPIRTPATERRRAAESLVALWTDVTRDLALCQRGLGRDVRGMDLLEESTAMASRLSESAVTGFLDRLGRAALLLRSNVSPELVLDDLALRWPRPEPAGA